MQKTKKKTTKIINLAFQLMLTDKENAKIQTTYRKKKDKYTY